MILRIEYASCNHAGITDVRLPTELVCWRCGAIRYVDKGRRIVSRAAFTVWLLGTTEEPAA